MKGKANNPIDWRAEKRKSIEKHFIEQNRLPAEHQEVQSRTRAFTLKIDTYSTGPRTWKYSRGIVIRNSDGAVIADVKRNYGHFWHCWIQHNDGNEYLLCGEDYQGYSIINLTQSKIINFLPESAGTGHGFCWASVYPSPDGNTLAVEGCFWGAPYELVLFDFATPNSIPLPQLGRIEEIGNFLGWENADICSVEQEIEVRLTDGKSYKELSNAEQDEFDGGLIKVGYATDVVRWSKITRSIVSRSRKRS